MILTKEICTTFITEEMFCRIPKSIRQVQIKCTLGALESINGSGIVWFALLKEIAVPESTIGLKPVHNYKRMFESLQNT